MIINNDTALKVAHLSRLQLTEAELPGLVGEMEQILVWMNTLNQLDTTGVEPLIHISTEVNRLRDDVAYPGIGTKAALANAPSKDTDYFRVPKVIE
jgi:aspartyl-tRNA(Asn)/glutamyl-tRNA(Gln) amidotransferase subunit C